MIDFGIVRPGTTLYIPFASYAGSTGASATLTGLATTDIEIYKDGGTTQRASDSGYALLDTDGIDFDGTTGIHGFSIDLADNTTAGFYAAGSQYFVVISSVTVDSQTVNFIAARFTIGYPSAILNTTIATLSSQTSFTLTAGPAEDDALNGMDLLIHDVASAVQVGRAVVADYTGSTKTVTLVAGTTFTAAAGDNVAVLGLSPLIPTVSGRTLDVSATGEAGVDWANIGSPTTAVNLSGTTVKTATDVETDTADIQSRLPAALVSGKIDANISYIGGAALSTSTAQLGVNVVQHGGSATPVTNMTTVFSTDFAANYNTTDDKWVVKLGDGITHGGATAVGQFNLFTVGGDNVATMNGAGRVSADVTAISSDATAADNAEAFFDGTGYAGTNNVIPLVTTTTTATNVTTVNGLAANVVTAASTAADFITEIQTACTASLTAINLDHLISTAVDTDFATTVHLNSVIGHLADNGTSATFDRTTDSLEVLGAATAPSAASIADAVWDEAIAGHVAAGSTGEALNAAGGAGDPWITSLPGSYTAGQAGYILGTNLNATVSSRLASASYTAPLDAAGTRAAVGLASANLDTQLGTIDTNVDSILADTGTDGVVVASGSKSGYTISGTITTLDALDTAQDSQHSTTQAAVAAVQADLPQRITKNTALAGFMFFMVQSADHVTAATGLTVTATRSLDGAAFASCANAVSEVSNGWYKIDLAAGDLNGNVVALKFTAATADARMITIVTQPT